MGSDAGRTRLGDRLSGAVVVLFALVLWTVVVPEQVDEASYGWMRPRTLPIAAIFAMGVFGTLLIFFAAPKRSPASALPALRIGVVTTLFGAAIVATGLLGFLAVAPVLAAAISLLCGERRLGWLLAGAVAVPLAIWLVVAVILSRPLP